MSGPAGRRRQGDMASRGRVLLPVLLFGVVATLVAPAAFLQGSLPRQGLAPKRSVSASSSRHRTALQAEKSDEERLEFMNSPIGQAIGAFAKFLSESPLNDGKIWWAVSQAGEYDEAAAKKNLDSYITKDKVVMFSFSK
eukprot:TRINITY_DN49607_c0_g1_i1.p3 TRINITY_DN49607_c0_g1~~TRINITY_DN49607_c0_g1_i1.p3  ORF type:complete len:139 (-),score=34.77 TRINITY_DN49607_c0_g1_i1:296-712(-)